MGLLVKRRGPHHCRLLFSIALQSSDQESSRLWEGLTVRCLLWQAVNRMCSQVGLASTPDQDRNVTSATIWMTHEWREHANCGLRHLHICIRDPNIATMQLFADYHWLFFFISPPILRDETRLKLKDPWTLMQTRLVVFFIYCSQ